MYTSPLKDISIKLKLSDVVLLNQKIADLTELLEGTPSEYNLKKELERIALIVTGQWNKDKPQRVSYEYALNATMELWLNYESLLKQNETMISDIKSLFSNSTGTTAQYDLIKKRYLPLDTE